MKPMKKYLSLLVTGTILVSTNALATTAPKVIPFTDPLDTISMTGGKEIKFDVGIGSGACRLASDPEGIIYTITDRGPNIKTTAAEKLLGKSFAGKKGKIFPTANFAPTIYKLKVENGQTTVLEKIQIKTSGGLPVSGISNPNTEEAWDVNGNALAYDPAGLDAEGIVKLSDGTFWIGEEYGPSILRIASDGRVIERWVPKGVGKTLVGAGYPIKENLPAIIRMRPLNRGIESMTASPDEKCLYFSMQSPLANPNKQTYKNGKNVRIFKIDNSTGKVVGEYVYRLDDAKSFGVDNATKARKQNDVKISELTAVGTDKLVVLERISNTTKFYQVDLAKAENIFGSKWDNVATAPTLEESDGSAIKELPKTLLLDSDDLGGIMKKIEGLAWFGGDQWIMVNDNDFAIDGDTTYIAPVTMAVKK